MKAVLSRGRGKAKYVQDATCRFADDPERVLSSRGRDEAKSNREFPLYVVTSIIETVCLWLIVVLPSLEFYQKNITHEKRTHSIVTRKLKQVRYVSS